MATSKKCLKVSNSCHHSIQDYSSYGSTLCSLDINGDGLSDLLVGAPTYSYHNNVSWSYDEGRVFVYLQLQVIALNPVLIFVRLIDYQVNYQVEGKWHKLMFWIMFDWICPTISIFLSSFWYMLLISLISFFVLHLLILKCGLTFHNVNIATTKDHGQGAIKWCH